MPQLLKSHNSLRHAKGGAGGRAPHTDTEASRRMVLGRRVASQTGSGVGMPSVVAAGTTRERGVVPAMPMWCMRGTHSRMRVAGRRCRVLPACRRAWRWRRTHWLAHHRRGPPGQPQLAPRPPQLWRPRGLVACLLARGAHVVGATTIVCVRARVLRRTSRGRIHVGGCASCRAMMTGLCPRRRARHIRRCCMSWWFCCLWSVGAHAMP